VRLKLLSLLGLTLVWGFAWSQGEAQGPIVRFISPQEGEILRGEVELIVEGAGFRDLETIGVAYFEYSRDGENYHLIAADNESFDGFQATWDTRRLPDGEYLLRATIIDLWNQEASAEIRVGIDNRGRLRLHLRVPQDFPTIEDALAHARVGAIIQVDAASGPYPPFTADASGIIIESVNGRAEVASNEVLPAVLLGGERIELRGFRLIGETALELEGQSHIIRDNVLEGITGLVVQGKGHLIENNELMAWTPRNTSGVLVFGDGNNVLKGNRIAGFELGALIRSPNNRWEDNVFTGTGDGIAIYLIASNQVLYNNIMGGNLTAIFTFNSNSNVIRDNVLKGNKGGIILLGDKNEVIGNLFEDHRYEGMVIYASKENLIQRNTFSSNVSGLVLVDGSSKNVITENEFLSNGVGLRVVMEAFPVAMVGNMVRWNNFIGNGVGLENESPWVIDARENYWGSPTGPYHPEANPEGLGDPVSDNVLFEPWLKEPYQ